MWPNTHLQAEGSGESALGNALYPAPHMVFPGHPGSNSDENPINSESDHRKHTDKSISSKMFPEEGVSGTRDTARLSLAVRVRCGNRQWHLPAADY